MAEKMTVLQRRNIKIDMTYLQQDLGMSFLMLALLVEYIFLATFCGLYFNNQFLHITLHNFSSSYRFL